MINYSVKSKINYRQECIIDRYREVYGNRCIPKNKQYWTLAAQNFDEQGKIISGRELDQVIKTGLISSPKQFYGVDLNKNIQNLNRVGEPEANWITDDIYQAMVTQKKAGYFNPAILHLDFTKTPLTEAKSLARILYILTSWNINDLMVVANFSLNLRYKDIINGNDIMARLNKEPTFILSIDKWKFPPAYLKSHGAGSATTMGTLHFFR